MNIITDNTINTVSKMDLVCLRDGRTNKLLNVSYTEDGLHWTFTPQGKSIYFKEAKITPILDRNYTPIHIKLKTNGAVSNRVVVEKFIPTNFKNPSLQAAEYAGIHKAYKLMYNITAE